MKKFLMLLFVAFMATFAALAQHEGHLAHKAAGNTMPHAFSRNLPMTRNGSGTGWLPDASPMFGNMYHSKNWMYMLHYNLFLRYDPQDFAGTGSRGAKKFDAPNWLMFMGQRNIGKKGLFRFSSMVSADALTIGGEGYPLLFQSGETYHGKPLVDRQHPHDLLSELSVSYTHAFSKNTDAFVYLAYPGEPALGPTAFMHRPSALYNPDAPLSHHWVDATHITFGVATMGVRVGDLKLEGSSFTGREPDENRHDFDKPRFDSWSSRLSYTPSKHWTMQASHGFLKSPEPLHAGSNIQRSTVSASFSAPVKQNGSFDGTLLWGQNKMKQHRAENAILLETSWRQERSSVFARYEYVQKSGDELQISGGEFGHEAAFNVNALTLGAAHDLFSIGKTNVSGGGHLSFYFPDARLKPVYGKAPTGLEIYLRIYPSQMK